MTLKFEQPKFYQYALVESRGIYYRVRALFDTVEAREEHHVRQPSLIPIELIYCHCPGDYILELCNCKEQPVDTSGT